MEERLKEVLAVVNDKGGVGKSTTAHNLACGLIRVNKNLRVLVIDADAQKASVSFLCGWNINDDSKPSLYDAMVSKSSLPVYQVTNSKTDYHGNLWLTPASSRLLNVDPHLLSTDYPTCVLKDVLSLPVVVDGVEQSVIEAFDYIVVDCPPALNLMTKNVMGIAMGIIIPVQMEPMTTVGLASVLKCAQDIKKRINPGLDLRGILKIDNEKTKTNLTKQFEADLDSEYGEYILPMRIPNRVKMKEAQAMLQDIFTYKPYDDSGLAYERLAQHIIATYK